MKIDASKAVMRTVRGLHLAVVTHNKYGNYRGDPFLVPRAYQQAKKGDAKGAYNMLKARRGKFMVVKTVKFEFTHAAAQVLNLRDRFQFHETAKNVTVALTETQKDYLRNELLDLLHGRKTSDGPAYGPVLRAALKELDKAS